MAFESLKAQIANLLDEIAAQPTDSHILQESLREKLAEMRALGLPLPEDLVELEEYLEDDFKSAVRRHIATAARNGPPAAKPE